MKAYTQNGELKVTPGTGGGGGSVTSAQFQTLSSRVATNSAQMTSANNAISAAVNVVSNAVSSLSAQHTSLAGSVAGALSAIAANSAQMTSADNALSAAINVVSDAASNALSVANAVSNRLSTWTLDNLANVSAPAPTDSQVLAFNSTANQWVASTIAAGVGSVTSAELSAVSAAAASADATLSGRVDSVMTVVSNQGSAIIANSAQMTSADNALSAAINVVSNAASNALSVANAVSNRLSTWTLDNLANVSAPTPTDGQVLAFNSAQSQWVASTIAAGVGSVTSAELSAVSAAAASADATLSARIDSVMTVVSNQGSAIVTNSAQMTSADNAISAAAAAVSLRVDSVMTVVSNQGSAIVANSAQMTSADNALSAAINVVSNAASNALSVANAVSNRLSTWRIDDLADVSASAPGDAQVLMWRSASAQWVASTPTAVSVPGADGDVIFNSAGVLGAEAALNWNRTANALQISGTLNLVDGAVSGQIRADSATNLGFWFQGNGGVQFDNFVNFTQGATFNLGATFESAVSVIFNADVTFQNGQAIRLDSAENLYFGSNHPAQITSNQTAWNPGAGNTFQVDSDASTREIQGILNDGEHRVITLINYGSFNILLMHENGAASATDRIATPDGGTFTLEPDQVVKLGWYETATGNRWVIMSRSQAGGGGGSVTSTELSAVSAAAASADATLSARIDSVMTVVSNAVSAIVANSAQMTSADNALSANIQSVADIVSGWATSGVANALPAKRVLAGDQIVSATAPVSISGFTFTVSGGVGYSFEFGLFRSAPISLAGTKLVLSAPAGALQGQYLFGGCIGGVSVINVDNTNQTAAVVTVSAVGAPRAVHVRGTVHPTANGTIAMAIGNNVSGAAAGSVITLLAGSYGMMWRMV
jgi:hypothetical protein